MAINTLSGQMQVICKWSAQNNLTGSDYQPVSNVGNISKSQAYGTDAANAALGGADQFISYILTITGNASATVDLTSLTNILQQSGISLTRVKSFLIRLLSATDDAALGTACNSVTVGNSNAGNSAQFGLSASATYTIKKGGVWDGFDQSTTGWVTSGAKNLYIKNDDATVTAKVQLTLWGGSD